MSNVMIGGAIYAINVPIKDELTTLKQRQEEASAELAKAGFGAADPKKQALIEELNAQIRVLEKQLSLVVQNIRQIIAMSDEEAGLQTALPDMLNASMANEKGKKMSQNLGALVSSVANDLGDDENNVESEIGFNTASYELSGLVSLDPTKLPGGNTKDEKLLKLNAQKTAIEEEISAISAKIASLMSSGLNISV